MQKYATAGQKSPINNKVMGGFPYSEIFKNCSQHQTSFIFQISQNIEVVMDKLAVEGKFQEKEVPSFIRTNSNNKF